MRALGTLIALLVLAARPAAGDEAVIGVQVGPTSLDPHFTISTPNQMTSLHLFDPLMLRDEDMRLIPGLAERWEQVEDHVWEFALRRDVRFHDGSPFTAEDVAFTVERVPTVPHSPASYAAATVEIESVKVVDAHTIRFRTRRPYPLFPNDISRLYIVSHRVARGATTQDFNAGHATIGTGPFRLVSYAPGERLVLERNEDYWGRRPDFARITLRVIGNDAARVAALLSGSVDLIDLVPPADRERLATDPRVRLWETTSARLIYMHMDHVQKHSPFISDHRGRPLPGNPLMDRRVRLALSKLIRRDALIERVLHGAGVPAGQLVPDGLFGHAPDMRPPVYDPEGARALLAEAGYADGFRLTIHGPNNRYINDGQVTLTVAQMLARGGIDMRVQVMPSNVFFQRAANQEFSLFLVGYGSSSGDAFRGLRAVLGSWDPAEGMGANNRGRYSNPEVDLRLRASMEEMDEARREAIVQEIARIAFGDVAIIPLYFQVNMWATRPGFEYVTRRDERTVATHLRKVVP